MVHRVADIWRIPHLLDNRLTDGGVSLTYFVPPKLLVYNSSYTQSINYTSNKLNQLHPK
jgi:hypothetical protein